MVHSTGFPVLPIHRLWQMIEEDYRRNGKIFGIPEALFFNPANYRKGNYRIFGQHLRTPFGVAAGPHTQLAQNIVSAWLCGASYIELKTVQTMDELEISKPCIDMQDEGYNCEWSQELKLQQSFEQYLDAWIIIHILEDFLYPGNCIFNMSVGYNLEGILKPNVQDFLNLMSNAAELKNQKLNKLEKLYPNLHKIKIPNTISEIGRAHV